MGRDTHLAQGSLCPPLKDGRMRVYSMKFCPYAQCTLLVLKAKNIDFDLVNVNLTSKPDWFLAKYPLGKVPMLEQNGNLLWESIITSDFLDEVYPEPALYPSDPWKKGKDKILIDLLSSKVIAFIIKIFVSCKAGDTNKEHIDNLCTGLSYYENELKERNSSFFGGERPGMLDYMLWPWMERLPMLEKVFEQYKVCFKELLPGLMEYAARMEQDPVVTTFLINSDLHFKYFQTFTTGNPNFDL